MFRSMFCFSLITLVACSSGNDSTGNDVGGSRGAGGEQPAAVSSIKSYVVLGDSISDRGGLSPFFYDLLVENDDERYPEWAGKDFKTRFGQDVHVVSTARAGSQAGDLPGQVSALPASLPGPVVVTITIGGNDMAANLIDILNGNDGPARDRFRDDIKTALTELTTPGRFGDGVEVHVFEADIYDPTDGTGDFSSCPPPLGFAPHMSTDASFENWNGVVAEAVGSFPSSRVAPLHTTFFGHGIVNEMAGWYHSDCIHPNAKGHNEVRAMFWQAITGENAP